MQIPRMRQTGQIRAQWKNLMRVRCERFGHRQPLSPAFVLLLTALTTPCAQATEWSMTPSVKLNEIYNDNFQLTSTPESAVTGTVLIPRVDFTAQQQEWSLTGSGQLQDSRYSGQSGLDTNDQYLYLQSNYNTQRSILQLSGTYAKESLLTSTQLVADIGLVHSQVQRITRDIEPSWTWAAGENTKIQLSYDRSDVTYGSSAQGTLFNYLWDSASLTPSYQLSERTQLFAIYGYSLYRVPKEQFVGTFTNSGTDSEEIGFSHQFSQTLTGSLAAGEQRTRIDQTQPRCVGLLGVLFCVPYHSVSRGSGSVYNASLQEQFERGSASLAFQRSVTGSGSGTPVDQRTVTLATSWQNSERLTTSLTLNAYLFRAVDSSTVGVDRNYYTATPGLQWRCTENLTAGAQYSYQYEKGTDPGSLPARANIVYLTLAYTWPKMAVSR